MISNYIKTAICASCCVVLTAASSCYGVSYSCVQIYEVNGQGDRVTHIDFKNRREWESFSDKADTVFINDSTILYWECLGAK